MAFQPEDSKYRSLEKPFPETAEEFILLEHFCLEEIMGVDWTSSGTGCHQLFFSAVPSINALLREYGMKGVSQDTWKELLEYFKTHFQLAAKPLAAKKLKLTWMGWDPKEKAKKERKLARERESLRKKWPEIPSLQQMKNDKNLWRRKIQEVRPNVPFLNLFLVPNS
ncbi:hypothetical protein NMY22_g17384 [Coprinellus aureogranulatus]|nr:hypothetical protein NMY22_g17384 [Coprinellus aureogranulatus]